MAFESSNMAVQSYDLKWMSCSHKYYAGRCANGPPMSLITFLLADAAQPRAATDPQKLGTKKQQQGEKRRR